MTRPLVSPGSETEDLLLEELADEARHYLDLIARLREMPDGDEREDVEADLYASISHLAGHAGVMLEHLDDLADRLPDDEEAETA